MSKKKYNGRLQPYKKIEIISKVLIGLYLANKLDEKLPMDEATMKVIIEFCIFLQETTYVYSNGGLTSMC